MTKRDLIDEIVRMFPSYSGRDAEVIVNAVFEAMTEALCSGERIEIRGFGSFVVKQRRAREGRNPKTGDIVAVAAKRVPFFKVGKELKQRVDREETSGVPPSAAPISTPVSQSSSSSAASGGSRSA
jgi:integration host factor beta subunit